MLSKVISWYGSQELKFRIVARPSTKKLDFLRILVFCLLQALLRWRAYLLHTCLPLRVSPKPSKDYFPSSKGLRLHNCLFCLCWLLLSNSTELPAADRREGWAGLAQDATTSWAVERGPGFSSQHRQMDSQAVGTLAPRHPPPSSVISGNQAHKGYTDK